MPSDSITFESTSRFAQLGDLRLHFNDVGEGDVLVMLHGGGPGATGWSNFKQNLPAFSSRFRVLLVDQPQFGLSEQAGDDGAVQRGRGARGAGSARRVGHPARALPRELTGRRHGVPLRARLPGPRRPARPHGARRRVHSRPLPGADGGGQDPRPLPGAARPEPREARRVRAHHGLRSSRSSPKS